MSGIAGRSGRVKIREVSVDEYVELEKVREVFGSEEKARTWATAWEAVRGGETGVVTGMMEEVLGRRPEEFDVVARRFWGV